MIRDLSVNFIDQYQRFIRPMLPECCRFEPCCSDYAKQALIKYGFLKGLIKAIKRLLLCHPFSGKAGYDPLI